MSNQIRESKIESYLIKQVKNIDGITYKFKSTDRGVPDRLIGYNGMIYLVEVKRPDGKPKPSQEVVHNKFKKRNITVYILDSYESINTFIYNTLNGKIIKKPKSNNGETTIISKDIFDI